MDHAWNSAWIDLARCDYTPSVHAPAGVSGARGRIYSPVRGSVPFRLRGSLIVSASCNLSTSSRSFAGNGSRSVRAMYFRAIGCKGANVPLLAIHGLLARGTIFSCVRFRTFDRAMPQVYSHRSKPIPRLTLGQRRLRRHRRRSIQCNSYAILLRLLYQRSHRKRSHRKTRAAAMTNSQNVGTIQLPTGNGHGDVFRR